MDTLDYLAWSPWTALIQMVNDAYGYDLDETLVTLVAVEPLEEGQVEVTLASSRGDKRWGILPAVPEDEFTVVYSRLSLEELLDDDQTPIPIGLSRPTTTLEVVRVLAERSDIVFDDNDFVHERIELTDANPYLLTAGPLSLRWYGELPIAFDDSNQ